ncbi:PucR family transcriptional regulator [Rhodococcus kronopolitis]|uniref:PucR family transcriptional regulator n=1 Tax=Rhodococcus kronopolitis TaxID=1460226 RepID=A0ABV9FYB4_9NOCA
MEAQSDELAARLVDRLTSEISEARDPMLTSMQAAVTADSLDSIRQMLQHGLEATRTDAPSTAIQYSRRLAQRGVAPSAMERANRLTGEIFLRWCLEQLELLTDDAAVVSQAAVLIMADAAAYGDRVAQQLAAVYEDERRLSLRRTSAAQEACLADLLAGRVTDTEDAERTLGYRLGQRHLGLVVWSDRPDVTDDELGYLERSVLGLAERIGCVGRPLFVPRGGSAAWVWMPLRAAVDIAALAPIVAGWDLPVKVAVGAVSDGVEGFGRTHRQALQAQLVAQISERPGPSVTSIAEVGPIALMCADLNATRAWVRDVLGPLGVDDPASARLRETVRVFLAAGSSFTATAEQLNMHKNSVVYRIRKAEEQRGRRLREGRLDLEIALALCHWLGAAVLAPAAEAPAPTG